jgi:replication initiation and membrane attachment protein DnaB
MPRRERFNPNAVFVVRKSFRAGGRLKQRGDHYAPKRDMLSMRRLRQLWQNHYLSQREPEPTVEPAPAPVTEPASVTEPESSPEETQQDVASDLESMTKVELVEMAKSHGIGYASQMNKMELVERLRAQE